jgi:hypothetical protein
VHVIPHERREGFWANIRGHVFDLPNPRTDHALAPTPDDLFIVSIAATLAWSAQAFLRARKLPDYVSIFAEWWTQEDSPTLADISLSVTVSKRAEAVTGPLATALESGLAARYMAKPAVRISLKE